MPEGLLDAEAQPAGRRFSVYRNNVAVSLTEAMHQAFPVITKLLGTQNMDGLAGIFLRKHPPSLAADDVLRRGFPEFLAGMEQLSHLGYLPDVARLELALRRSYHAADSEAAPADALGHSPEDIDAGARLEFAPSMQVLQSTGRVLDLALSTPKMARPQTRSRGRGCLITRPTMTRPRICCPQGGAHWIAGYAGRANHWRAFEETAAQFPEFDLGATLALLLQGGAITSVTIERLADMTALISLHNNTLGRLEMTSGWLTPTLARLVFAATLLVYYWNSAKTKLGSGFFGFLSPSDGAYVQIFPKAMEAVSYDSSQLGFIPLGSSPRCRAHGLSFCCPR